ncbi:50S ribosomal protein L25 [bacterium]|nr:MAG: 50S ribosomal protein L25 [bacterium]
MEFNLKAQKREILGKQVKKLRKEGFIPAVIYGHKFKNIPLKINRNNFLIILKKAGESTVIKLEIEGDKIYDVLIHDMLRDPVSEEILHIDFYRIKADEAITTEISLIFENISPAVEYLGGILITNLRAIKVKALSKDLPHDIKVDLSSLKNFNDHIKVSDLPISEKVEILTDLDDFIALIKAPRTQEEIEALDEEVKEDVEQVEGVAEKEETGSEEAKDKEESAPSDKKTE